MSIVTPSGSPVLSGRDPMRDLESWRPHPSRRIGYSEMINPAYFRDASEQAPCLEPERTGRELLADAREWIVNSSPILSAGGSICCIAVMHYDWITGAWLHAAGWLIAAIAMLRGAALTAELTAIEDPED